MQVIEKLGLGPVDWRRILITLKVRPSARLDSFSFFSFSAGLKQMVVFFVTIPSGWTEKKRKRKKYNALRYTSLRNFFFRHRRRRRQQQPAPTDWRQFHPDEPALSILSLSLLLLTSLSPPFLLSLLSFVFFFFFLPMSALGNF